MPILCPYLGNFSSNCYSVLHHLWTKFRISRYYTNIINRWLFYRALSVLLNSTVWYCIVILFGYIGLGKIRKRRGSRYLGAVFLSVWGNSYNINQNIRVRYTTLVSEYPLRWALQNNDCVCSLQYTVKSDTTFKKKWLYSRYY